MLQEIFRSVVRHAIVKRIRRVDLLTHAVIVVPDGFTPGVAFTGPIPVTTKSAMTKNPANAAFRARDALTNRELATMTHRFRRASQMFETTPVASVRELILAFSAP